PMVGREVLVRRRAVRVVEDLADLPVAPGAKAPTLGLDMHGRIPEREPGDEKVPVVHHPDTGWRTPCCVHPFLNCGGERGKPCAVRGRVHLHERPALCSMIRSMSSFPEAGGSTA